MCSLVEMQIGPCNLVGVRLGIAEAAKQSGTMGKVATDDCVQPRGGLLRQCIKDHLPGGGIGGTRPFLPSIFMDRAFSMILGCG